MAEQETAKLFEVKIKVLRLLASLFRTEEERDILEKVARCFAGKF